MNVAQWYAENMHLFPDLVSGECPYCGPNDMMIVRDTGLECYNCGERVEK